MCYVLHLLRFITYLTPNCLFIRAFALKKSGDRHPMSKQPNRGKRDRSVQFWCDTTELEFIQKGAAQTGISRGNYCRQVLLGHIPQKTRHPANAITRQEVKELHKELRAIGTNLNQLAKVANTTQTAPHLEKIESGIEAFTRVNQALLEALK